MKFTKKMKEALSALLLSFSEVSTDKGILSYDTEELKEGDEVFLVSEDGERSKPEDGDYVADDGRTIRVADGKVAEIVAKAEEAPEDEPKVEENPEELKKKVKCEDEVEAEPEAAPEETVEEVIETVEEAAVEEVDALAEALAKIDSKLKELEERISKIENSPAAEPIVEEFSKATKALNTKDSHLEFLKKMASGK